MHLLFDRRKQLLTGVGVASRNAAKAADGEVECADIVVLESLINEIIARHRKSATPDTVRYARTRPTYGIVCLYLGDQSPECVCILPGMFPVLRIGAFDVFPNRDRRLVKKRNMHDRIGVDVLQTVLEQIELVIAQQRI